MRFKRIGMNRKYRFGRVEGSHLPYMSMEESTKMRGAKESFQAESSVANKHESKRHMTSFTR